MAFLHRILNWIFGGDEVPPVVSSPDHYDGESSQADGMKPQEEEQETEDMALHHAKRAQTGQGDQEPAQEPGETPEEEPEPEPEPGSLEAWKREQLRKLRGR